MSLIGRLIGESFGGELLVLAIAFVAPCLGVRSGSDAVTGQDSRSTFNVKDSMRQRLLQTLRSLGLSSRSDVGAVSHSTPVPLQQGVSSFTPRRPYHHHPLSKSNPPSRASTFEASKFH